MSTKRFYIALLPPEEIGQEIQQFQLEVQHRYHSKAALNSPVHLTVHPPFELSPTRLPQLLQVLTDIGLRHLPLSLMLEDFGAFIPNRVIFVTCHLHPDLVALRHQLHQTLSTQMAISHPSFTTQPFHPHFTVALYDLTEEHFPQAWQSFEQRPFVRHFSCQRLVLLEKGEPHRWFVAHEFGPVA